MPVDILVTGADGFVGRHLGAELARSRPDAAVAEIGSRDEAGEPFDLRDAARVDALFARLRPRAVVHLAAQASVGAAGARSEETWRVNLGGTLNLALAVARFAPDATVLFASSSEVYGKAFGAHPVDEEVDPLPVGGYATSKRLGELLLAEVLPATARLIVARAFNHTGPGQRGDFALPSWAGQIARIERGLQAPVIKVGNLDAARDILDVRDVVAAYRRMLATADRLPSRLICNVASGKAHKLRALLAMLVQASGAPFEIEVDPARLRRSDIPVAIGNGERLRALVGWQPAFPIERTVADLLDYARRLTEGGNETIL